MAKATGTLAAGIKLALTLAAIVAIWFGVSAAQSHLSPEGLALAAARAKLADMGSTGASLDEIEPRGGDYFRVYFREGQETYRFDVKAGEVTRALKMQNGTVVYASGN